MKACIHTINGFSAHADQAQLLTWHAAAGPVRMTFPVHGNPVHGMKRMAELLAQGGRPTTLPKLHDRVTLE